MTVKSATEFELDAYRRAYEQWDVEALLSLYAGGRLLDGIWPARYLAVSNTTTEVGLYEDTTRAGGTSEVTRRIARSRS